VAGGLHTGLYLYGQGGVGKSHTVLGELARLNKPYILHNSRMSGWGLYRALEEAPDDVHVLEDMETLYRDRAAMGVLRSALWSQSGAEARTPHERPVTWVTRGKRRECVFTGGIIMTANRPFDAVPELAAVVTRLLHLELVVTEDELAAHMRWMAAEGYRVNTAVMDPAECREVCAYLVDQARLRGRPLDMRTLVTSCRLYLQWRECHSGCHWRALVASNIAGQPVTVERVTPYRDRASRKSAELAMAREIAGATPDRAERLRLWQERTAGKSEPTLYRRLQELGLT
jgi:hypothetical protein